MSDIFYPDNPLRRERLKILISQSKSAVAKIKEVNGQNEPLVGQAN